MHDNTSEHWKDTPKRQRYRCDDTDKPFNKMGLFGCLTYFIPVIVGIAIGIILNEKIARFGDLLVSLLIGLALLTFCSGLICSTVGMTQSHAHRGSMWAFIGFGVGVTAIIIGIGMWQIVAKVL